MLTVLLLATLANYAVVLSYKTLPFLESIRKFIEKNIHYKLVHCTFCVSFWLSPITLYMANLFSFDIHTVLLMLSLATSTYILDGLIELIYRRIEN